jgi:hypothetical protein
MKIKRAGSMVLKIECWPNKLKVLDSFPSVTKKWNKNIKEINKQKCHMQMHTIRKISRNREAF